MLYDLLILYIKGWHDTSVQFCCICTLGVVVTCFVSLLKGYMDNFQRKSTKNHMLQDRLFQIVTQVYFLWYKSISCKFLPDTWDTMV